jgi:beta-lactamase regulating signal transducer with metallopeptidase domain
MENIDNLNLDTSPTSINPPSMFQFQFEKMTNDMRFVGMFAIIYGALTCLSIIGALIGVPIIFVGLRMREAADQFSTFRITNNAASMRAGFELQGKFFHILKILIIVQIVLIVLMILFFVLFISYFISTITQYSVPS